MGGIIPPKNDYSFTFNEIEKLVGEVYGGLFINYKFLGASGQVNWKTKEFKYGEQHGWGTISLYFRF